MTSQEKDDGKLICSHYITILKITKQTLYGLALYKIKYFIYAWGEEEEVQRVGRDGF